MEGSEGREARHKHKNAVHFNLLQIFSLSTNSDLNFESTIAQKLDKCTVRVYNQQEVIIEWQCVGAGRQWMDGGHIHGLFAKFKSTAAVPHHANAKYQLVEIDGDGEMDLLDEKLMSRVLNSERKGKIHLIKLQAGGGGE